MVVANHVWIKILLKIIRAYKRLLSTALIRRRVLQNNHSNINDI